MTSTNILGSVLGGGSGDGGSGEGFGLGPLPNTFTNTGARNTYAAAHSTWLAQYNADQSFWIKTNTAIQRRNSAGSDWEPVTPIITGKDGSRGTQGAQGVYDLEIYIASTTVPTLPVGGSLIIATNVFSSPPAGWTEDIPTGVLATDESIFVSKAKIDPKTQTGTVVPVWQRPTDIGNPVAVLAEAVRAEAASVAAKASETASAASETAAETAETAAEVAQTAAEAASKDATASAIAILNSHITAIQGYITAGTQSGLSVTLTDTGELNINVASSAPTHTGDQYLAVKATNVFVVADFTGALGLEFPTGSHTVTVPDIGTANYYFAIARLASDPTPTFLDVNSSGFNEFGSMIKASAPLTISSASYDIYVSHHAVAETGDIIVFR